MPNPGDLMVGGVPPVTTQALTNVLQVATGPGALYEFNVLNFDTIPYLILLLDQVANPTNKAVIPIDQFFIPAVTSSIPGQLPVSYAPFAMQFKNGLWIVTSTTVTTPYTLVLGTNNMVAISAKAQTG